MICFEIELRVFVIMRSQKSLMIALVVKAFRFLRQTKREVRNMNVYESIANGIFSKLFENMVSSNCENMEISFPSTTPRRPANQSIRLQSFIASVIYI